MATMNVKKTGSTITSWEFYIENDDKNWKRFKTELKVENGPAYLLDEHENQILNNIKNGTAITILDNKSKKITKFEKSSSQMYAKVKIGNKTGYMSIKFIGKLTKRTTLKEDIALSNLDNAIKEIANNASITIIVKDDQNKIKYVFENCTGAKTIKGTPKADFCILSGNKPVCFISHKNGVGPSAFQQYVSITGKGNDGINDNKVVSETLKNFVSLYDLINTNRKRFKKTLSLTKDKDLILRSIYGINYGASFGIDHVHLIGQGNPVLKQSSLTKNGKQIEAYELSFSSGMSCSGELAEFSKPGYIPVILARFQSGRKFYSGNTVHTNIRILIAAEFLSNTAKEI